MEKNLSGLAETVKEARDFVGSLRVGNSATVVALYGDLGSGKTTFVKAGAETLGVSKTVTSPTFVLEKVYKLDGRVFDHLIHIDAYRLENAEELASLGWDAIVRNPKNLIFVEWADRVEKVLPETAIKIVFRHLGEHTRKIIYG